MEEGRGEGGGGRGGKKTTRLLALPCCKLCSRWKRRSCITSSVGGWRRLQESREAAAVGRREGRGHPRSGEGEAGREGKPLKKMNGKRRKNLRFNNN